MCTHVPLTYKVYNTRFSSLSSPRPSSSQPPAAEKDNYHHLNIIFWLTAGQNCSNFHMCPSSDWPPQQTTAAEQANKQHSMSFNGALYFRTNKRNYLWQTPPCTPSCMAACGNLKWSSSSYQVTCQCDLSQTRERITVLRRRRRRRRRKTTTTTTTIAFKGAIRDFLQSPHCTANHLQYAHWSGPGAILCKSCATHRALITCNMLCNVPSGTKGQLSY